MISKELFFDLERRLKTAGLDSDYESFDVIKNRLNDKKPAQPDEFARAAIYVIFAGGFSQKTAKSIHQKVMGVLETVGYESKTQLYDKLIKIFNNKNKINATIDIWAGRKKYRDDYYALPDDLDVRLAFLARLPHIGKITANHLARNLGEDIVKYDIWIQRLGVAFAAKKELASKINNGNLHPDVKRACDEMFNYLVKETGLARGYIDVVLWKAAQNNMIEL